MGWKIYIKRLFVEKFFSFHRQNVIIFEMTMQQYFLQRYNKHAIRDQTAMKKQIYLIDTMQLSYKLILFHLVKKTFSQMNDKIKIK